MIILQVHNMYRIRGGEEVVVEQTLELLKRMGNRVELFMCDSRELGTGILSKFKAFSNAIYSPLSKKRMRAKLRSFSPDVVHVHNVHPLLSPSILSACNQEKIPVVMTCHNYRLVCPAGLHISGDSVCNRCLGGQEYWCVLKNCKSNFFVSLSYALRNYVHRKRQLFVNNMTLFIALSNFQKDHLIQAGLPENRFVVLPNMVEIDAPSEEISDGNYVGFVGRVNRAKGIDTLLEAAEMASDIPIKVAGDKSGLSEVTHMHPSNVEFMGRLQMSRLYDFYKGARFVVVPSKWYEACPMVVLEAMAQAKPIIASRIGSLSEFVKDGETGLLFEPGNAEDLINKMRLLWENPILCRRMGYAGREKAIREHSEDMYYKRLMGVYETAIAMKSEESPKHSKLTQRN